MCANHLPGQSMTDPSIRHGDLTIVSVIYGTGVHDLGSDRRASDENALMLD
jgi:hypothetical protein